MTTAQAVHRPYARKAKVKLPSLEQAAEGQIIQLLPLTSESDRAARLGQTVG